MFYLSISYLIYLREGDFYGDVPYLPSLAISYLYDA